MIKEQSPPRRMSLQEAAGQVEQMGKILIRQLEIFEGNHLVFRRLRRSEPLTDYAVSGLVAGLPVLILHLKASGQFEKLDVIRGMVETARTTRAANEYATGVRQEFLLCERDHLKEGIDRVLAMLDY